MGLSLKPPSGVPVAEAVGHREGGAQAFDQLLTKIWLNNYQAMKEFLDKLISKKAMKPVQFILLLLS